MQLSHIQRCSFQKKSLSQVNPFFSSQTYTLPDGMLCKTQPYTRQAKHSNSSTPYESLLYTTFAPLHQNLRPPKNRFVQTQKLLPSTKPETQPRENLKKQHSHTRKVQTLFSCNALQSAHNPYFVLLQVFSGFLVLPHLLPLPLLPALFLLSSPHPSPETGVRRGGGCPP